MSTRGVIARAQGDGWAGVYNHHDSYPTYLGKKLWEEIHHTFKGDVDAFLRHAIEEHLAGWSFYPTKPYPPGNAPMVITSENAEPLFHEWVYCFSPRMLTVFGSTVPEQNYELDLFGSYPLAGPEPNWSHLECGELLERCSHLRYVHDGKAERPDYAKGQDFGTQYHQT